MRMIAAKWKLWIVILITSLLRVDGAAKLVLTISSYRSNSKKKDRKEGQKLIQGAMIRKDGRRKKKRRDQKNEVDLLAAELAAADFSCPITLSSRVSFSFEESKAFAVADSSGVHFIWPFCNHYMSWSSPKNSLCWPVNQNQRQKRNLCTTAEL